MALSPTLLSACLRPLRLGAVPAIALVLCGGPALATTYKCAQDDGQPFYQDAPCAAGRELRNFDVDPANVSVVPFTLPRPAPAAKPGKAARAPPTPAAAKPRKEAARAGDAGQRRFLRPGMSEGEVIARVGTPDMTATRNRKSARWTYMPVPEDRDTITNVTFENGRVAEVERKVIK